MKMSLKTPCFLVATALSTLFPVCAQDSVQLKDGRFVLDQKMERTSEGVTVHFAHGDVFLPDALIQSTTAASKDGSKRQVSAKDQAQLDKGKVFFNGRWMAAKAAAKARDRMRKLRTKKIKEALAHRKWVKRYKHKTKHFEFEYTIDPKVMKDFSNMMETYYKVFCREWKIKPPPKLGRLKVCFYHDEDTFHQVGGVPRGVLGYFRFVMPIELNFFYDRMDTDYTYDVMFHEANHFLTYLIDPKFRYPRWVNEGMAEYYGASEWDSKKKKMTIGHLQEGRLAVLRDVTKLHLVNKGGTASGEASKPKWMGLEQLIKETEHNIGSLHYAWAWSFMHFMFHGENGKYAAKFKKLYIGFAKDKKVKRSPPDVMRFRSVSVEEQIKTIKRYLGVTDLKALDREWHDYIRGLKATGYRGKMRAGQFALWANMPIKAERLLKESLAGGNKSPLCYYYLGQAQYRKDKYAEAEKAFTKLIELDPLNGMAYIHLARCKDKLGEDDAEVSRLRKLAGEVDPDNYSVAMEIEEDEDSDDK